MDDLANDVLVGNGDNLAVFVGKNGMGEVDLLNDAPHALHANGVANNERSREDNAQPRAVVRQQPLHREPCA